MESFFSRYKNGLVLLVVLLVQLFGLALQVRRPLPDSPDKKPVRLLRYWMLSLVSPPARVTHGAGRGVRGLWSNYIDLRHVRERNQELEAEVERLRLEQGALVEDARQGQRLQHLLDFREHYIYKTATAQVIGTAGSDRARLLIIDKGSRNGIDMDMPVITPDGIVGRIREVSRDTAQVLEISDQSSGAGVMLETTRIRGVLRGNANGQPQIINIMPDDRIQPGERVLTSGGDQIYPRGLTVGVVDSIEVDPDRDPYIDVIVKPSANLAQLEEVLVITSTGDQLPPGEAADLAKSEAEAKQHSAADVLSEKLPSIRDPNADPNADPTAPGAAGANAAAPDAKAKTADSEVARPLRPAAPLHPDRFTPGASPDAASSLPGIGAPVPPHMADTPPPRHRTPSPVGAGNGAPGSAAAGPTKRTPPKSAGAVGAGSPASGASATTAGAAVKPGPARATNASDAKPAGPTGTEAPRPRPTGSPAAMPRSQTAGAPTAGLKAPGSAARIAHPPASPSGQAEGVASRPSRSPNAGTLGNGTTLTPARKKAPAVAPNGAVAAPPTTPKYVEPYFVKPQPEETPGTQTPAPRTSVPRTSAPKNSGATGAPTTTTRPAAGAPKKTKPTTLPPGGPRPMAPRPSAPGNPPGNPAPTQTPPANPQGAQ